MPRKSIVLVGLSLVLSAPARGEKPLSVLAYNIFFRPHLVGLFDQKADRYPAVRAAAAAFDVVGLSEAFVEHYRDRLRRDLKATHPYAVEYRRMLLVLGRPWDVYRGLNTDEGFTWDGVENPLAGNGERQRIDYVLCRHCAGREGWFRSSRVRLFPLKTPIGKAKFGSDHYAVEARLVVPNKGAGSPAGGSAISGPRL